MAETTQSPEKRAVQRGMNWYLLVGFVLVCLLLIGGIWTENLSDQDAGTPSFYRDTFIVDESMHATATAEAAAELTATP